MEFINHVPLANYFASLLETVSSYSFRATATDTTTKSPSLTISWPPTNPFASPLASSTSIEEFKASANRAFAGLTRTWAGKPPHTLCSALPPVTPTSTAASQVYDTSIRPVLQMGPFSIAQETELIVPTILRTANSLATAPGGGETTVDWTSGYFSVQEEYRERVLDSRAAVRIVTAAPEVSLSFSRIVIWLTERYDRRTDFMDRKVSRNTFRRRIRTFKRRSTIKLSLAPSRDRARRTSRFENGNGKGGRITRKVIPPLSRIVPTLTSYRRNLVDAIAILLSPSTAKRFSPRRSKQYRHSIRILLPQNAFPNSHRFIKLRSPISATRYRSESSHHHFFTGTARGFER